MLSSSAPGSPESPICIDCGATASNAISLNPVRPKSTIETSQIHPLVSNEQWTREIRSRMYILIASDFGGVWYWNRYPGARVDSETPFYQLNIPAVYNSWNFSQRFPDHAELRKYM